MAQITETIIQKKKLTTESKFSYCPYCFKDFKEYAGMTYKDALPKLIYIKKMLQWNTEEGICKSWEEVYFCEKCGRNRITSEDFRKLFCCRADGTKYTEPPMEKGEGV